MSQMFEKDVSKNNLFQTSTDSFEPCSTTMGDETAGDTVDEAFTDYETFDESVREEDGEEKEFEYCDFYFEDDILEFLHFEDVD
uniref:Uncharacterized protein n=1 Tax=Panagrolaimus superbus TaxID=310955 RepID=A0A914YPN9_9BILA